jgi:hypothetical protein
VLGKVIHPHQLAKKHIFVKSADPENPIQVDAENS